MNNFSCVSARSRVNSSGIFSGQDRTVFVNWFVDLATSVTLKNLSDTSLISRLVVREFYAIQLVTLHMDPNCSSPCVFIKLKLMTLSGAISVHGVNGNWGRLAAGLFNMGFH